MRLDLKCLISSEIDWIPEFGPITITDLIRLRQAHLERKLLLRVRKAFFNCQIFWKKTTSTRPRYSKTRLHVARPLQRWFQVHEMRHKNEDKLRLNFYCIPECGPMMRCDTTRYDYGYAYASVGLSCTPLLNEVALCHLTALSEMRENEKVTRDILSLHG